MNTLPRRAVLRRAACVLFILLIVIVSSTFPVRIWAADGHASVSVQALPDDILADGKSSTLIVATVRDGNGNIPPDGTSVQFSTNLGVLKQQIATTSGGQAQVTLISAATPGTATVQAISFVPSSGSSLGTTTVEFTNNRDDLFSSGASRWIRMDCPEFLVYSADMKIVEADGHDMDAHLRFRGLDVTADSFQLNVTDGLLLTTRAVLKRGRHELHLLKVRYNINANTGVGILAGDDTHSPTAVTISDSSLTATPEAVDSEPAPIESNPYRFTDTYDSRVVVKARAIDILQQDRLEFRHATIYADGRRILSVPLQVMSVSSDQLFGQQLLGLGTQGIFLNVPVYYHVDPSSTGTLYIRNSNSGGVPSIAGIPTGPSFNTGYGRPGLSLDLNEAYTLSSGAGSFLLNGLTTSEWGASWNQQEKLGERTNSFFTVEYPDHRSLFASSNIAHELGSYTLGVSGQVSESPTLDGYSSSEASVSTYLSTQPKKLGASGIAVVSSVTVQQGTLTTFAPSTGRITVPISSQGLDFRFFSNPLRPDKHTLVTDSLDLGQAWNDQAKSDPSALANINVSRPKFLDGQVSVNYTFSYDPLMTQISTAASTQNPLGLIAYTATEQRFALTYTGTPMHTLLCSLTASYGLPLNDTLLTGNLSYRLNRNWNIDLITSLDRYGIASYRDNEIGFGRRILGRDFLINYSTFTKKVTFNLASAAF